MRSHQWVRSKSMLAITLHLYAIIQIKQKLSRDELKNLQNWCNRFGWAEMIMNAALKPWVTTIILTQPCTCINKWHLYKLLQALSEKQDEWASTRFDGTYQDAKAQAATFLTYKQTTKRTWVTERQDVATLLGNVITKLRTYRLREYVPPPGLHLSVSKGFSIWNYLFLIH